MLPRECVIMINSYQYFAIWTDCTVQMNQMIDACIYLRLSNQILYE